MADELAKAITHVIYPVLKPEGFQRIRRREFIRHGDGIVQRLGFQVNSWGGRDFCVSVSANIIASNEFVTLQPGFRLSNETNGSDLWLPSRTSEEARTSVELVLGFIEKQALPFFERSRTIEGFSDLLAEEKWASNHHLQFQQGVAAAMQGRADDAERHLNEAKQLYAADGREWCFKKIDQVNQLLEAVAAGNAPQVLSQWMHDNANAHGVNHVS